ncbi:hypothetical protein ACXO78_00300 [Lactobacillus delbrueckii subsp. bulgaricus]
MFGKKNKAEAAKAEQEQARRLTGGSCFTATSSTRFTTKCQEKAGGPAGS